jgi:hypothetical protein
MDVTEIKEANDRAADPSGASSAPSDASAKAATDIASEVAALVDDHPVATLLAALGVGYVAGGGFFTSLTRRLLGAGLRLGIQLAVVPALESELAGLVGNRGKSPKTAPETEDADGAPQQRGGES